MLKEAEIRTFIEGTTRYFEVSAQQSASVGSPYLVTDGNPGVCVTVHHDAAQDLSGDLASIRGRA